MIRLSQIFLTMLFLLDLISIAASWLLAYQIRFHWWDVPATSFHPPFESYIQPLPLILALAGVCFLMVGLYKNLMRSGHEAWRLLKACLLFFVLLLGLSFFYRGFSFSRIFSLHFVWLTLLLTGLGRILARQFLAFVRRRGKNLIHVLVIGSGSTAQNFINQVQHNQGLGIQIHGYLAPLANASDIPHLGPYGQAAQLIESEGIQQVYIALDSDQQGALAEINYALRESMVDLFNVPDVQHSLNINPEIMDLDGTPIIALRQSPLSGWNRVIKRLFDYLGAMLAILLFSPCFLIIPLLIKLTSRGPILYRQCRTGLDGNDFWIYKFRSMKLDAESGTGAVWAQAGDDRTTAIGGFLRKTSLDEIPQFFNVLQGRMSLVGPRPERPELIENFKKEIPNYMLRHKMQAGITGWAQVNGWRGNTSLEKRIEYDIYYLTNWSLWLDIKILLLTPIKGFVHPNAY